MMLSSSVITNSTSADEEQARERQVAAAHLVAADRERGHGGGHRLADVEDVDMTGAAAAAPAASATIIVSPIARLDARISAATIPETAAGKTTRMLVVSRRAPRP